MEGGEEGGRQGKNIKSKKKKRKKWREILCSWVRRLDIVKITVLPKLIYTFNTNSIQIPARF